MAILKTNDKIGDYIVQSIIKSNLYTETYRVEDYNGTPFFLKLFILKRLPSTLVDDISHAVKEIEYCKQIKNKNIISFVSSGTYDSEEGECPYYITNYFSILFNKIHNNLLVTRFLLLFHLCLIMQCLEYILLL